MTRFVVVTPVLNGTKFLGATLASVRAQTDSDWVHYLIDGGSTDGSLELLAEAVTEDSRRRLVTGKDRSLYDALFKGFEHAAADGIADSKTIYVWLGSDDLVMPWAFATLRQKFDQTGAEWITALGTIWDSEGRLVLILPTNWYPRRLIRAGLFHNRSLGGIQMESTFFTHNLYSKLSDDAVERIRSKKLAGDFLLWRELAEHAALVPIMSTVAGFRNHGGNLSSVHANPYFDEIRDSGVWLPPPWLGRVFRVFYRPVASLMTALNFRQSARKFESDSISSPPDQCPPSSV